MRNQSKIQIVLCCLFYIGTNCTFAYAADYEGGLAELKQAIADTELNSNFYQRGNIVLDASLGAIQATGTLSIIGSSDPNYSIDGDTMWGGFTLAAGQTLKINQIGALNTDGSVASAFTRFSGGNGSVVNNAGTLEINKSVFSSNSATNGGAIYNTGTSTIINSSFKNNVAANQGGAIYNTGSFYIKADGASSMFSGNTDSTGSNSIYNTGNIFINTGDSALTGTMGSVTFDDKVILTSTGTLQINTSVDSTLTTGTVTFNDVVSGGNAIVMNGGTVNFLSSVNSTEFINQGATINLGKLASATTFDNLTVINPIGTLNITNANFTSNSFIYSYGSSSIINFSNSIIDRENAESSRTLFNINSGTVNLNNTEFRNFNTSSFGSVINNYGNCVITGTSLFKNNQSYRGGAIYNYGGGKINFNSYTSFVDNIALDDGGAIDNNAGGILNINNGAIFTGNAAGAYGGAIVNTAAAKLNINSTTIFEDNIAHEDGGAIYNYGGADANINTTTFKDNHANRGGAIYNYGGADANINTTTFKDNIAHEDGGAIYNYDGSSLTLNTSTFDGNTATFDGGAIYNWARTTLYLDNVTFKNNEATTGSGGAIYNSNAFPTTIIDSKFENNTAANGLGGAIYSTDGIINIIANANKTTSFSGNTDSTGNNDITMAAGTLNLNTGANGAITFGGTINASGADININSGSINPTLTTGSVTFGDKVTANNISIFSGITSFKEVVANALDISGGANTFNEIVTLNSLNITGGSSEFKKAITAGVIDISGGTNYFDAAVNSSDIDITGGTTTFNLDIDSTFLDITGGTVNFANGSITDDSQIILNNTDSVISFVNSTFNGTNYTSTNSAVNVLAGSMEVSGSRFDGYTTAAGNGGVINNAGSLVISNSRFTGNSTAGATSFGGAIYNSGTLYIKADGASTVFSGNTDSTGSNAIYSTGAIYLNAGDSVSTGTDGNITFDDSIFSTNAIHINSALGDTNLQSGFMTFNNSVTSSSLDITNGTIRFNDILTTNQLDILNGNVYFADSINADDINISNGNIHFDSALASSNVNVTGGTIGFNSDITSSTLNLGGGTTTVKNSDGHNINVSNGIFNLTGGTANFEKATFLNDSKITVSNASTRVNIIDSYLNGEHYTGSDSVLKVLSGTLFIDPTTLENYSVTTNGGVINNAGTLILDEVTFNHNTTTANGGAIYNTGTATVSDSQFNANSANFGGAIYNSSDMTISSSNFDSNSAFNGGAIYNNAGMLTLANTSFTNNTANAASGLGGAIYNKGSLNIVANNANVAFANNKASGMLNDIYLEAGSKLNLNVSTGNKITFAGGITSSNINNQININKTGTATVGDPVFGSPTTGEVVLNSAIKTSTVGLYGGTLSLAKDDYLNGNNLSINSNGGVNYPTLNMINNETGIMNLNVLTLNSSGNLKIDADLANELADKITASSVTDNTLGVAKININQVNLLSDSTNKTTSILVSDANVRDYVALSTSTAESALYKYNLSYNAGSGRMEFENTHIFTPSVVTNQVGALVGSYFNQINTYSEALSRADVFMSMPQCDRMLMRYNNKYAAADNGPTVFSPTFLPEEQGGLWVKQFTSFENIPLNSGPNVSNVGYGALIGADTSLKHFSNGWDGYLTAYVGYNGSHQNYDGVGIYQNGGNLGVTGTAYKNNFFIAATASVGASNGNASTTFGTDNFTNLLAGLAVKTGYNFEFLQGKLILQPSYTMSYTFINTFDYQAASGANISSDPLNAIQISPGIKLIANLKDGWQPYIGVNMMWNLMDIQKVYANDVQLPEMSIAPYVEYGVGLQRRWGERFSGFGQAMLRSGGRNGVALQLGFRWAIGQ